MCQVVVWKLENIPLYEVSVSRKRPRKELSITWRWQEVVQTVISLGNTVKEFLISLRSTAFE